MTEGVTGYIERMAAGSRAVLFEMLSGYISDSLSVPYSHVRLGLFTLSISITIYSQD